MLKHIKSSKALPWLCIGDFNEVLHRSEHEGVQERSYAQIEGFREMVDVCGLHDLGYEGRRWTFEKKVVGGSYCRVRLDRALSTPEWNSRFPFATVRNMIATSSDHGPILLQCNKEGATRRKGREFSGTRSCGNHMRIFSRGWLMHGRKWERHRLCKSCNGNC